MKSELRSTNRHSSKKHNHKLKEDKEMATRRTFLLSCLMAITASYVLGIKLFIFIMWDIFCCFIHIPPSCWLESSNLSTSWRPAKHISAYFYHVKETPKKAKGISVTGKETVQPVCGSNQFEPATCSDDSHVWITQGCWKTAGSTWASSVSWHPRG